MDQPASPVDVTAWRPPVPGIREVLHARFQAHLTRRFRRLTGTTPGRYARRGRA